MGRPSGPWGGQHSCSQRIGADLVAAAPGFKHEQRPKREAPVTGQARVLADDALQCFAFEYVTHHGAGRQQLLANVIAQTVLEPVAERNGESLFFAPEELRGKNKDSPFRSATG